MALLGSSLHAATPIEKLRVMRKLKTIIIPQIKVRDASIADAFDIIARLGREADKTEKDPVKKGVNIILRVNAKALKRKISFDVRQVTMLQVLDIVTNLAELDYRIEKGYVMVVPKKPPKSKTP
jgi:hypothetical protein